MKNKIKIYLGLIVLSLFWNACTVQKCMYSKGFNVDFKGFHGSKKSNESTAKQVQLVSESENDARVEESEVKETNTTQAPTHLMAMNQINAIDISEKGLSPIKSVTNVVEIKDRIAYRASKSLAQTNVLSHVNTAPLAPDWLILLLCIFFPPIAVALMSNGNIQKILIALLLWILGVLPGVIYALLVYLHYL